MAHRHFLVSGFIIGIVIGGLNLLVCMHLTAAEGNLSVHQRRIQLMPVEPPESVKRHFTLSHSPGIHQLHQIHDHPLKRSASEVKLSDRPLSQGVDEPSFRKRSVSLPSIKIPAVSPRISEFSKRLAHEIRPENQSSLVSKACPTIRNENLSALAVSGNRDCLAKISKLGDHPEVLYQLFASSIEGSPIYSPLDQVVMANQYTKTVRAAIAESHFNSALPIKIAKVLKITPSTLNKCSTAFGFSRMFSQKNEMGASTASDIDFKWVVNPKCLAQSPDMGRKSNLTPEEIKSVKLKFLQALQSSKSEMDPLGIHLEVDPKFTVETTDDFHRNLYHDPREREFLATTVGNSVHLTGSEALYNSIQDDIHTAFSADHKRIRHAASRSYLSLESNKMSIGQIASGKRGDSLIGSPGAKASPTPDWIMDTKVSLARVYDAYPDEPIAQSLNENAMVLQSLKVKHMKASKMSDEEIQHHYTKIGPRDFSMIYQSDPGVIHELVMKNCHNGMVQKSTCEEYQTIHSKIPTTGEWTETQRKEVEKFGRTYFSDLFTTADQFVTDQTSD